MKVYSINDSTNVRDNNYVNNGFFINNVFVRVYGKNKLLGKVIKVVNDYFYEEDKIGDKILDKSVRLAVGQNLLVKQGVGQLSDSLNKIAKENVKKRTYYKWYLIEMDKSLGLGIAGRNKYVREDVVKLVK
jgi:hypothetical protein